MIELNDLKLCEHCFSVLKDGNECTECKKIGVSRENYPYSLPESSILQGKYVIGKLLYYDDSYFAYMGYDIATNTKVLIRELFPGGFHCTRSNKALVFTDIDDHAEMIDNFNDMKNNFCTEVNHMMQVKNNSLVSEVLGLFEENNTVYCVVSLPKNGLLLSDFIASKGGKLSEKIALDILQKLTTSVDKIHQMGIIHGNIRPENIIIDGNGSILLTGFNHGSFKYITQTTTTEYRVGEYAPIEIITAKGTAGQYSDVYAMGTTIYHVITGRMIPHSITRITTDDEEEISFDGLSDKLKAVIKKMIALRPADRYANAYELARDLNRAGLASINISARREPPKASNTEKLTPRKKKKLRKSAVIITAAIIVALIVGLTVTALLLFTNKDGSEKPEKKQDKQTEKLSENEDEAYEAVEKAAEEAEEKLRLLLEEAEKAAEEAKKAAEEAEKAAGTKKAEEAKEKAEEAEKKAEEAEKKAEEAKKEAEEAKKKAEEAKKKAEEAKKKAEEEAKKPEEKSKKDDSTEEPVSSLKKEWKKNVMLDTSSFSENSSAVLGNTEYSKNDIVQVTVQDSLEGMPEEAWDISYSKDGSVMAWVTSAGWKRYHLYLGADGGINAEKATERLFQGYEYLESVEFNGNFHTDDSQSMAHMFHDCKNLKSLSLEGIKTENVVDMTSMFENLHKATEIVFSEDFVTDKVTSMKGMFDGCSIIAELDLSMFKTSMVKDMSSMFYKCKKLKTLDLSGFTTIKVTTFASMFEGCKELEALNISGFSTTKTTNVLDMFKDCDKLELLETKSEIIKAEYEKR